MKTLYLTRSNNILIDTENNTVNRMERSRQAIDEIFLVEEPMHVVYGAGEVHDETDVEKGDIVITFYENTFKKQLIVVKNSDWTNNLIEYKKKEQEEKERWAEKNAPCGECDCDCQ